MNETFFLKWYKVKNSGTNARTTQKYILRWTTWQKTTGSLPRPRRNTNSGEKFNNINISMCVKMCICLFILLQTYFQFRQLPCSAAHKELNSPKRFINLLSGSISLILKQICINPSDPKKLWYTNKSIQIYTICVKISCMCAPIPP